MRLVNLPSMSAFWRLSHCPAWPQLGEGPPHRSSSEETDRATRMAIGSWCHAAIAAILRGEPQPPLPVASWTDEKATDAGRVAFVESCAAACATVDRWIEWYRTSGVGDAWDVAIEQPIALHALDGTARALLLSRDRAYDEDLEAFEIPGTPDLACKMLIGPDEPRLVVFDWKTTVELELPEAREAWAMQLQLYALAWSAMNDDAAVEVRTLQVGPDDVRETVQPLEEMDLAAARASLRDAVIAYAKGTNDPRPGPHCSGCPSRSVCPVGGAMALQAVELVEPPPPDGVAVLPVRFALARPESPAHAAWLWDRLGLAEAFLDGLRAEIRAWVADQPGGAVRFPDGRVAAMFEQSSRSLHLESPGAFAALAGELGPEAAEAIAPRKTSMAAIERAVRERLSKAGVVPARGALKEGRERVVTALRGVGAMRESTALVFRVRKPAASKRLTATPDDQLEAKLRASVGEPEPEAADG
jgi:PD-(D/E)XK nuclease superfamily